MSTYKVDKAVNKEAFNEIRDQLKTKGASGAHQHEPVPIFNQTPRELVIKNKNSWIVLGGDRAASPKSGKAGLGSTQASAIDICVGRHACQDGEPPDNNKTVDPNYFLDSARVYITQQGDVDTYFGIAKGVFGDFMSTEKKSAVVAKADHVRIIAKEGIKLVTGKGKTAEGDGDNNTLGKKPSKVPPIEFIAGNYTDDNFVTQSNRILQPLVKGENLVEYLLDLHRIIARVMSLLETNTHDLVAVNSTLSVLTAPSPETAATHIEMAIDETIRTIVIEAENQNLTSLEINYLEAVGKVYINSNHVYTT